LHAPYLLHVFSLFYINKGNAKHVFFKKAKLRVNLFNTNLLGNETVAHRLLYPKLNYILFNLSYDQLHERYTNITRDNYVISYYRNRSCYLYE